MFRVGNLMIVPLSFRYVIFSYVYGSSYGIIVVFTCMTYRLWCKFAELNIVITRAKASSSSNN